MLIHSTPSHPMTFHDIQLHSITDNFIATFVYDRSLMIKETMKENEFNNTCAICGNKGKLSFEHIPPKNALNNKPVFIQNAENLFERKSRLFEKKKKSPKGFGRHSLCESCNNNTGSWYAKDFGSFIQQNIEILKLSKNLKEPVQGTYLIKPLNVLKQICAMFMSSDTSGHLRSQRFADFILNRESQAFPDKFSLFLYSNVSPIKRLMGVQVVYHPELGIQKWSEITFPPFGYLLAEESEPAHESMVDITAFRQFRFDQEETISITTSILKIDNPFIGFYSEY